MSREKNDMAENIPAGYTLPMLKPWRFAVLEDLREKAGLTQKELAGAAGHDPNWYHQVQKWSIEPSWTDVLAMAAKVRMNLDSLRQQLCKAAPVTEAEVRLAIEKLPPKKRRGGTARVTKGARKVAERPAPYLSGKRR